MLKKHRCPCCDNFTFSESLGGTFEICPVCYWEDDNVQLSDPTFEGGANPESLNQARANYRAFGAVRKTVLEYVRPATQREKGR